MINAKFWKAVKEKWIRNEDPALAAVGGLVNGSGQTAEEIEALNQQLNGEMNDEISFDSLNDLLEHMGMEDDLFGNLFTETKKQ